MTFSTPRLRLAHLRDERRFADYSRQRRAWRSIIRYPIRLDL